MGQEEIIVDLQSLGARIEVPVKDRGRRGGAGPSDGKPFILCGTAATVPTFGEFTAGSPYAVVETEGEYFLTRDGQPLMPVAFPSRPRFYDLETGDGIPYWKIALLHGQDTLATTVLQRCIHYGRPDERCQFCAIEVSLERGTTIAAKKPEQLAQVAEAAARLDGIRHFVMTTGTPNTPDKGTRYMARCVQAVKKAVDTAIQVQLEPPEDLDDLKLLRDAGVDNLGLHLESFDQPIRERVLPGKAKTPVERYFEAFRRGVEIFGRNHVSSYIIVGLGETPESVVEGCRRLAEIGVYPFVVPLRPILGTPLETATPPAPALMARIYAEVAAINRQQGLHWRDTRAGCAYCRACSALPSFEGE